MITIEDLTGIQEGKRKEIVSYLDDLISLKDARGDLSPIISGYNCYNKLPIANRVTTFSNIHRTEIYKQDMLRDLARLGYDARLVLEHIRDKTGALLWDTSYNIRDHLGNILPGLRIRDLRTGRYLDLRKYLKNLCEYSEFSEERGSLVAEDPGWQLDMPFSNKIELMILADLFLKKSGEHVYDKRGIVLPETEEEKMARSPWTDSYRSPVLIVGEGALSFLNELPHFDTATRISLIENGNEISFIIHRMFDILKGLPHYATLKKLGFKEEVCLGNKSFLIDIDETKI